jgi:pimeloyl-ACP methyl ester carboxylesterase
MHALTVVAAFLGGGAAVTFIGAKLIERAHPPCGRFLEIGGLRQHVVELGDGAGVVNGPAIVLLHGAGCNLEDMRLALAERLAARHRVILLDRPGLGWSERRSSDGSSPAYQAAMLSAVLDRLGVDRVILVGHSWGGLLALTFALDYPHRVAGLVVIAPPTHPRLGQTTWLYSVFAIPVVGWVFAHTLTLPFGALLIGPGFRGAFLPQLPPPGYMKRSAARLLLRPATLLANAADIAGLKAFLKRQAERYDTLAAPIVVITGDRDTVVSPRHHAMRLAAAVPGARMEVLPGFGHMLHHAAADRTIAAVEELIYLDSARCKPDSFERRAPRNARDLHRRNGPWCTGRLSGES